MCFTQINSSFRTRKSYNIKKKKNLIEPSSLSEIMVIMDTGIFFYFANEISEAYRISPPLCRFYDKAIYMKNGAHSTYISIHILDRVFDGN